MSRRLIIILLIVLIVGVVGGAAALVVTRLRTGTQSQASPTPDGGQLTQAELGGQNVVNPTGDDDGDSLTNSDESLWGTNAKNPDTDGDGFLDGEEVKANFNPTIPSPSDKLPEGFKPGKDLQPLDVAPTEAVAVDQFFQDNLDLSLGNKNYTDTYKAQYGADTRTPETLIAFVKSQPIVTQLPTPADRTIQTQKQDSPLLLDNYLEVAGQTAIFSNRNLFGEAVNDLFGKNDPSTMQAMALVVRHYQEQLIQLPIPPVAVSYHKLLLGYTQLLSATFDQVSKYPEDRVRAVLAMRQWQEIDAKYVPLIQQESARLKILAGQ